MFGSLGFGFMKASFGASEQNRESTIEALHEAIRQGVTLFDTADIYAPSWDTFGHNEELLAEAIRTFTGNPQNLFIATKGGITRKPGEVWSRNASLDYLLRAVEASAGRLNLSSIPLWQHHRLDPNMPFESQLENLAALKQRGLIENIGVSNYSAKQLERAIEVIGTVASVQNQLNPAYRQELDVLKVCEANNIVYLPWSPTKGARQNDAQGIIKTIAAEKGASTYAVAIAWLRSLSSQLVPIPGVTRPESVLDSLSALKLNLTEEDLTRINEGLEESAPMDAELLSDQPTN
ncbi:MAG: aldo/keto reductase [Rhodoluna sp.]|nr:aldo/keto reductase [Rhodoluna sp.]